MAQDTLLGFPANTLPYRRGEFSTLSTDSAHRYAVCFLHTIRLPGKSDTRLADTKKRSAVQRTALRLNGSVINYR